MIALPSAQTIDESLLLEEDGVVILDATEIKRSMLEKLRIEHDDYHFAQDLARQDRSESENGVSVSRSLPKRRPSRSPDRSVKKKRKPKAPEAQGIAKYFIKNPSSS